MNRWLSYSLGIESKAQLKSHRMDRFRGLLLDSGLDLALAAFWSAEERALEIRLWKLADQDYEARKTVLLAKLEKLSPDDLATYYEETGEAPQDIAAYLKASPADDAKQAASIVDADAAKDALAAIEKAVTTATDAKMMQGIVLDLTKAVQALMA